LNTMFKNTSLLNEINSCKSDDQIHDLPVLQVFIL
jgi:hypothetical protein